MKNKILVFIIGLLILIPSVISFFDSRMPTFHDETQIANIYEYHRAISLGQFPPRWAPDMHFEYGSPFPEFNYQLPYYLTYLLSGLGLSLTWSFKMVMVISAFLAYTGFFLLSLQFSTPLISLLGAVVYSYTPYRAVNLFVRGTLGESLAFSIFPFILLLLYRLHKKPTLPLIVATAISVSLLVITHQPASALALPFIYLCALGLSIFTRQWRALIYQALSGILSLFLAAFYWLPVILERQFLAKTSPFNFYDHFPFIKQLIYSPWGYGGSVWGPYDHLSFQIGFVNLIFIALALIALVYLVIRKKFPHHLILLALALLSTFLSVFLMNIRSSAFWQIFPFTQEIQFPWRLLMVTTFFTPLLGVISLSVLSLPKKHLLLLVLSLLLTSVILDVFYFRPGDILHRDDQFFLRSFLPTTVLRPGETVSPLYLMHNEDYAVIPKNSTSPTSLPPAKVTSLLPDTTIVTDDLNPFKIISKIHALYADKLTIHTFYFPGWHVTVDGQPVPVTLNYYGAMTLNIPSGVHELQVSYTNTRLRAFSNIISVGSWIFSASFLCLSLFTVHGKRRA